ncbi:MAG: hypothetical protein IT190_06315 [Microbacteriaceae bacterium]|nr:hypothetical protein [Microbacteriaceae bacterium]
MRMDTSLRSTKLVALLVAAAVVVGVAGCTGDADTPPDSGSGTATAGSPSPDDDGSDAAECLIGDWIASDGALEEWYRSFVAGEDIAINSVSGELLLSFSDSDFVYSTRDLTVEMTIADQNATTQLTGGAAGTYRAEPGGIMSTTVESSDFDGTATVSGIEFSAEELGLDLTGAGAFVGYECTAAQLVLETQSVDARTSTIELLPAG